MRIFVTGATGFIGSAVVDELVRAGHHVTGLARNDAGAASLERKGVAVHRGDLEDHASIRRGAATAEAVVHLGFIHDFTRFAEVCANDAAVIRALGDELAGSQRPLLVASGAALPVGGGIVTEDSRTDYERNPIPRKLTEQTIDQLANAGLRAGALRFPPTTHGAGDHGFIAMVIDAARKAGASAYVGDGANRWPACHRLDAAAMVRLAIESPFAPGARFHAIAEEGVPFHTIAEAIGHKLQLPTVSKTGDAAAAHFGWFLHFAGIDVMASSAKTRAALGWAPVQPGLLADIAASY